MKTTTAVLLGFALLFQSSLAEAAISYDASGSVVDSSSLLANGVAQYSFYFNTQSFGPSYGSQTDLNLVTGFRVGIRDRFEVGLALPVRVNTSAANTGMTFIMASARLQLASYDNGQRRLFLTFYHSTGELQGQTSVTSGQPNTGYALSMFNERGRYMTRYLIKSIHGDLRTTSGIYGQGSQFTFAAGSRFGYENTNHIWLDFIYHYETVLSVNRRYLLIAPSFEFPKPSGLTYYIGGAVGLPTNDAAPLNQITFGFRYTPPHSEHIYAQIPVTAAEPAPAQTETQKPAPSQSPAPQTAPPAAATQKPAQSSDMVDIPQGQGGATGNSMAAPTKPAPDANSCKATVEIVYFKGQHKRAEALATTLRAQGYCVKSVVGESLTLLESEIYIRSDVAKDIVSQLEAISGAHKYSVRDLPWGTDVRIILGKY